MKKYLLILFAAACLSACTGTANNHNIQTNRHSQQISHDKAQLDWRRDNNIPLRAAIAITAAGNIVILQENTPAYTIAPTLDPYLADFAPCYLRREAIIAGKQVILEIPCRHAQINDDEDGIFRHQGIGAFPGRDFDISALSTVD